MSVNMKTSLDFINIEPTKTADAVVIWLHGLGDSGAGFAGVVPVLGLPNGHATRFIFPHAPEQPVTINGGMVMPSWYDIKTMDVDGRADLNTLQQSEKLVSELIDTQISQGISAERIILAGFSQGGVLALFTGLRNKHKLAGIAGLSCYLATNDQPQLGAQGANKATPIFSSHGQQDNVVPFAAVRDACERLMAADFEVTWSQYSMEHSVCEQQLQKMGQWINKVLSP